jgi:hypothetical protein
MTVDSIKDVSKITEELVGFATSEEKDRVNDRARRRKKKGAKQSNKETEDSGDTRKEIYTQDVRTQRYLQKQS